jgi:PPM family protein phosphatase
LAKQFTLTEYESAGLSVAGPMRTENQDAILLPGSNTPTLTGCLHAIADGMGGYANGALASALALKYLREHLRANDNITAAPHKVLKQAFEVLNFEVYKTSQELDNTRMGTTLTAAYIIGNLLNLLHIGDSRAYLIRNGRGTCLTQDHTVVGDMVRAHILAPTALRTHAQRSVLTRAAGLSLFAQPELSQTNLQIGDRIILCSDGLWAVMEDAEIVEHANRTENVQTLTQNLLDLALARETDDNCSVVTIQIRGFRYQTFAEQPDKERHWLSFLRK